MSKQLDIFDRSPQFANRHIAIVEGYDGPEQKSEDREDHTNSCVTCEITESDQLPQKCHPDAADRKEDRDDNPLSIEAVWSFAPTVNEHRLESIVLPGYKIRRRQAH
jgi:hypothetical protein